MQSVWIWGDSEMGIDHTPTRPHGPRGRGTEGGTVCSLQRPADTRESRTKTKQTRRKKIHPRGPKTGSWLVTPRLEESLREG